jgi:putative N6-adenine-specific DNA methylase
MMKEDRHNFRMVAKTFKGLEEVLAQELIELGANEVQLERRAVSFKGDKAMLYRANLCLRTALRVLVPVRVESLKIKVDRSRKVESRKTKTESSKPEDQVYEIAKSVKWERYMTEDSTFAIDATVYSDSLRNSRFVTYRVKDAIADYWTEKTGKRPNVNTEDPDVRINVHIANEQVTVSLDSSG